MVSLKDYVKNLNLKKSTDAKKNHAKLLSMQRVNVGTGHRSRQKRKKINVSLIF